MDLNVLIDGTTITLKSICETLEKQHSFYQYLINSGKSIASFDIKNISTGYGHGSIVYKLVLHFQSPNDTSSESLLSIAIKIPSCEIFYQQKLKVNPNLPKNIKEIISQRISRIHKNECFFYSKISPFLKNLKLPKIYEAKEWIVGEERGYILMEDLSDNGIVLSKYDFVLEDTVKVVVKEIANFQAKWIKASLNIDWRGADQEGNDQMWTRITNNFLTFVPKFIDLVENKEKIKNDLEKIMFLIGNKNYHIWTFEDAFKELGLPTVLVHGDLWNSNIFFKKDSGNEILAFIDWQMVYEGSPVADLARYLLLNTEGAIRRKIESTIFSFYFECIHAEIPNISICENQIRKAYIYSFITEFIGLLMITVNNAKSLQHLIDNGENVQANLAIKEKIIFQVINAVEDIVKFIDEELTDVVERFRT